jgi:hypothetical protein
VPRTVICRAMQVGTERALKGRLESGTSCICLTWFMDSLRRRAINIGRVRRLGTGTRCAGGVLMDNLITTTPEAVCLTPELRFCHLRFGEGPPFFFLITFKPIKVFGSSAQDKVTASQRWGNSKGNTSGAAWNGVGARTEKHATNQNKIKYLARHSWCWCKGTFPPCARRSGCQYSALRSFSYHRRGAGRQPCRCRHRV